MTPYVPALCFICLPPNAAAVLNWAGTSEVTCNVNRAHRFRITPDDRREVIEVSDSESDLQTQAWNDEDCPLCVNEDSPLNIVSGSRLVCAANSRHEFPIPPGGRSLMNWLTINSKNGHVSLTISGSTCEHCRSQDSIYRIQPPNPSVIYQCVKCDGRQLLTFTETQTFTTRMEHGSNRSSNSTPRECCIARP